jgi:ABC-type phosphate/phosphonate transport system substrate-binding protein
MKVQIMPTQDPREFIRQQAAALHGSLSAETREKLQQAMASAMAKKKILESLNKGNGDMGREVVLDQLRRLIEETRSK